MRMEHIGKHLEKDRKEGGKLGDVERWTVDKELEKWLLDEGIVDVGDDGGWRIGNGKPMKCKHEDNAGVKMEV
jgi:hypothetical protein